MTATIESGGAEQTITGSHLLVATGRSPSIADLDLDTAGVRHERSGIVVNRKLKTGNRRVYAIGECIAGAPQLTQAANYHDRVINPFWLAVFIVLQFGRLWVIASLGRRWTTRVIVLPGAATIAQGPYRWLRHPNYLSVALEIAVVPLALGLPFLAFIFSAANAALLAYRIRIENQALARAAQPT